MIVAISGSAGSGKDTTGDLLGKKLGLRVVKSTLKTYAKEKGLDILDFEKKYAAESSKWDRKLDAWQRDEVRKGNLILVSQLSAYNAPDADIRVWLSAPEEVRAERLAKRDKIPHAKALAYIESRDREFRNRIKGLYGIDAWDPNMYDLVINTAKWKPAEVVKIIMEAIKTGGMK
jgi:cytidylate kinase